MNNKVSYSEANALVTKIVDSMEASATATYAPSSPWPTVAGRLQGLLTMLAYQHGTPEMLKMLEASIETPKA